ncbi:DUF2637 domain-containing protein [Streptomyces bluensis]|uniref:DUF2637 domain-containing protein n=1 Tax=Streptomyces bluensis TaxID=33897 RepID=A0ABW6UL84_9ACTN
MTVALGKSKPAVPPLSRPEKALLGAAAGLGVGVGGIGLASSFGTVSAAGARWGFSVPQMLPIGIDTAIPVFTLVNLMLIRMDMPLAWVRWVPWGLTGVTCWLNVAAGHSLSAKIAHGTMPLLWVVLSEVAAHVYAVRIGAVTGRRLEKIRRSRWLLAFPSTFALWRRMTLWEITSYADALDCERQRLLTRAELREEYGRGWRWKAPRRTRVLHKLGELTPVHERTQAARTSSYAPEPASDAQRPESSYVQVTDRTPPVKRRAERPRTPDTASARAVTRRAYDEAETERKRQRAQQAYADSLDAGRPIGPKALGKEFGFSEGWGRKQIKAVVAQRATRDAQQNESGRPLVAAGAGGRQ